jgi:hypothetical protein
MPHRTFLSIYFKAILWENGVFRDFYVNRYGKLPIYGALFVYTGQLGAYVTPR